MKDENGYLLRFSGDAKKILLDMGYFDERKLTDETLKELGFYNGKLMIGNVLLLQCENKDNIWVQIYDQRLSVVNKEQLDNMIFYQSNRWKTVGKLKMLIEALRGG